MAPTEENDVAQTEEKDFDTVGVQIKGRGVYRSYKFVFLHLSRTLQDEALKYLILETNPDAEEIRPLYSEELFDLVGMVASWKSAAIYEAFLRWRDAPDSRTYELDESITSIMGESGWAPSLKTLAAGRFL